MIMMNCFCGITTIIQYIRKLVFSQWLLVHKRYQKLKINFLWPVFYDILAESVPDSLKILIIHYRKSFIAYLL